MSTRRRMSAHWSMSVYTLGPRSGCHDVPCAGLSWHPESRCGQGRCTLRPTADHRPTAALFNRRLQLAKETHKLKAVGFGEPVIEVCPTCDCAVVRHFAQEFGSVPWDEVRQ